MLIRFYKKWVELSSVTSVTNKFVIKKNISSILPKIYPPNYYKKNAINITKIYNKVNKNKKRKTKFQLKVITTKEKK